MSLYTFICLLLLAFSVEARIYAWGVNDYGQLGLQQTYTRFPVPIPAYENIVIKKLLASGTLHMAVAEDGQVYVSGNNWYGGLGLPIDIDTPYITHPQPNPYLTGCTIYIGRRHGNAVCQDGKFYGWGVQSGFVAGLTSGNYGKLRESLPYYKLGSNVVDVMAGDRTVFVKMANGTIFVAGQNGYGTLGVGDTKDRPNFVVFNGFNGINANNVSQSHAEHVCTVTSDYKLYCWGANDVGQLGIGNYDDQDTPQLVSFFVGNYYPVQVTTGVTHTVCLTASGRVFTWGKAENGALGNGKDDNSTQNTPMEITILADKNIIEIVSGKNFNFARTSNNTWYAWGAGSGGVFGTQADYDILKPALVSFLSNFSINSILTAATSRSVYGYLDPSAPTVITGPTLVNECASANPPTCAAHAHCQDTETSWECVCDSGYSGSPSNCQDINECLSKGVCVASATACINNPGSFNCTCPSYAPIGDGKSAGTGCSPAPVVATTSASNGQSTTGGATGIQSSGSSTSPQATSGNFQGTTGNNVITTAGNGGNGGTTNGGATNGATTNGGATNGGTTNGGATTGGGNGNGGTTSTSTSGGTTASGRYETLGGVNLNLEKPVLEDPSEGHLDSDASPDDTDHYKNAFIGTVAGFGVLGIGAGVVYWVVA